MLCIRKMNLMDLLHNHAAVGFSNPIDVLLSFVKKHAKHCHSVTPSPQTME